MSVFLIIVQTSDTKQMNKSDHEVGGPYSFVLYGRSALQILVSNQN